MNNYPLLLTNPDNEIFNLSESEVFSLKEALELIQIEKYAYSLFAIWNCVVINIQRRIEEFGIEIFLKNFEGKENFNKEAHNLKDRWLNINEYQIIQYAKKINIINHSTQNLITMLYWMKSNTNEEETKLVNKEEINAIVYLLEKNLFLKEFKQDMRKSRGLNNEDNPNRRQDDKTLVESRNTHNELLIKTGVNVFKEESNKTNTSKGSILDKYC